MVNIKYATKEEAKIALTQQKKNWIIKFGIDNYKKLVAKSALEWYYKNRDEINEKRRAKRRIAREEKNKIKNI